MELNKTGNMPRVRLKGKREGSKPELPPVPKILDGVDKGELNLPPTIPSSPGITVEPYIKLPSVADDVLMEDVEGDYSDGEGGGGKGKGKGKGKGRKVVAVPAKMVFEAGMPANYKDISTKSIRKVRDGARVTKGAGFTHEDILQAFMSFDMDKNGFIGVKELKYFSEVIGVPATEEEMDVMLGAMDEDGDNAVGFDEFKEFVNHTIIPMCTQSQVIETLNGYVSQTKFDRDMFVMDVAAKRSITATDVYKYRKAMTEIIPDKKNKCKYKNMLKVMTQDDTPQMKTLFSFFSSGDTCDMRQVLISFSKYVQMPDQLSTEEAAKTAVAVMRETKEQRELPGEDLITILSASLFLEEEHLKERAEMLLRKMGHSAKISKCLWTEKEFIKVAEKVPGDVFPQLPQVAGQYY